MVQIALMGGSKGQAARMEASEVSEAVTARADVARRRCSSGGSAISPSQTLYACTQPSQGCTVRLRTSGNQARPSVRRIPSLPRKHRLSPGLSSNKRRDRDSTLLAARQYRCSTWYSMMPISGGQDVGKPSASGSAGEPVSRCAATVPRHSPAKGRLLAFVS